MLMRALTVDSQAVQRHRATILECVKVFYVVFTLLGLSFSERPEYFVSTVLSGYGMQFMPQD